jgi:uncharacterized membrane protein required for colicin V production
MVDSIVLLVIIFFALGGMRKGLAQYLLELLITAIGLAAAWLYYQKTSQILKSFLTFLWIFLGLLLFKWLFLKLRRKKTLQKLPFSFSNNLAGAILGVFWGTFIVTIFILIIEFLPLEMLFKNSYKQKVQTCKTYQIIHHLLPIRKFRVLENISYISKVSADENAKMRLIKQPELQQLLEHPSFKTVMEDVETARQLQSKDLLGLLTNPKIINLINDGRFVEKLLKVDFKKAFEGKALK